MIKTIAKEASIVILLLIAVSLILGILFYDYIPMNKIIPNKIEAYVVPNEITEELQETMSEGQNIVRTYYIDSSDLNVYEATNDYNKGKSNPFGDYTSANVSSNENTTTNTTTNSNTQSNTTKTNKNTSEAFFNTSGK